MNKLILISKKNKTRSKTRGASKIQYSGSAYNYIGTDNTCDSECIETKPKKSSNYFKKREYSNRIFSNDIVESEISSTFNNKDKEQTLEPIPNLNFDEYKKIINYKNNELLIKYRIMENTEFISIYDKQHEIVFIPSPSRFDHQIIQASNESSEFADFDNSSIQDTNITYKNVNLKHFILISNVNETLNKDIFNFKAIILEQDEMSDIIKFTIYEKE